MSRREQEAGGRGVDRTRLECGTRSRLMGCDRAALVPSDPEVAGIKPGHSSASYSFHSQEGS